MSLTIHEKHNKSQIKDLDVSFITTLPIIF